MRSTTFWIVSQENSLQVARMQDRLGQRVSMRRVGLSDYRVRNLQKRARFFTRTLTALRFGSVHPTAPKLVWCTSRFVRSARRTSNVLWSTRSARSTQVVV